MSSYMRLATPCTHTHTHTNTHTQTHTHTHTHTVYVNVYETGKCSVLAAPDAVVAEELADIVCEILLDAYQQANMCV